ncbi:MAG TPA: hypothetical protein VFU13_16720 [Steroidobacteraceae bacterium]|nr:hypothetical protein [Steroidobacteraceae bacterium]
MKTMEWLALAWATALLAGVATPTAATTLIRADLEALQRDHSIIAVGQVVASHSYWNADRTFILTDVRFAMEGAVKGNTDGREIVITLMGGTVGKTTTLIVAGAELVPGRSYLLFLNRENLPGARGVVTVREHSQGAFDLVETPAGRLAISQARGHALVPDASGRTEPAGGQQGLPLDALIGQLKQLGTTRTEMK